ncbi:hypothetical protein [Streptomyces himalayensis]|uniref:Uncharacterized protein n=1 Tax=Streptomyces himalayensis subsp. himalayensis TaxID=2756131 RepID=A0A7W0DWK8_9ACTN|nr:hypothetical protein [Streptomyces himalayensis]MBA2951759.1 hypothetical protein [Streptomyces himalayensis subsp. himalayensis]
MGVHDERIGRLVLTSCEALENYPPDIKGKTLHAAAKIPGALAGAQRSSPTVSVAGVTGHPPRQ